MILPQAIGLHAGACLMPSYENLEQLVQMTGALYGKAAFVYNVLGRRAGFTATNAFNDVREFDNASAINPALSNSTLEIISSNAADSAAGTGVRQVKVTYINAANALVESPAITLNGITAVASVLAGVNEILWMEAFSVGSGGVAAGNIRLRLNGAGAEVEQITAGGTKSMSARFMVPQGFKAYICRWSGYSVNNDQDVRLLATVNTKDRSVSSIFQTQDSLYFALNTSGERNLGFLRFPALSRLKVQSQSAGTGATVKVGVSLPILLVSDT